MKINENTQIGNTNYKLEQLVPFVLYEDATGINNGTTNLNDSINNYEYIEVFGVSKIDNDTAYTKIPKTLFSYSNYLSVIAMDGNMYVKFCKFNFTNSGATLKIGQNSSWYKNSSSSSGAYDSTGRNIYIMKIIGYK